MSAVRGIFARENGQGMFFEVGEQVDKAQSAQKPEVVEAKTEKKKPTLTIVK
jgi:stringent starvation protein B